VGRSPQRDDRNTGESPAADGGNRRDSDRRFHQADRFALILKLSERLQGRDCHETASLAKELEVSRRPILRDIDVLRLAGVGLDYDPSNKGFFLHGDDRFAVTGQPGDELLGQATGALASAKGQDAGEGAEARTQELHLADPGDGGQTYRELRRQEDNFSPPGTTFEREERGGERRGRDTPEAGDRAGQGGNPCRATITLQILC
jgi:biotin operon repressor